MRREDGSFLSCSAGVLGVWAGPAPPRGQGRVWKLGGGVWCWGHLLTGSGPSCAVRRPWLRAPCVPWGAQVSVKQAVPGWARACWWQRLVPQGMLVAASDTPGAQSRLEE